MLLTRHVRQATLFGTQCCTVKYPETYIIGSNGKVLSKIIAGQNWMEPNVLRYVESLL